MHDLPEQAIILAPLITYVYLQARVLVAWDSGWRALAILLVGAQILGAIFLMRLDPSLLQDGIVISSSIGIAVLIILWLTRQILTSAH
ncbi:MAG: hypothetical protein ACE5EM_11895 [Sphingomonadales bacterium]